MFFLTSFILRLMVKLPFFHVDDQSIILFHSVQDSVSGLWEWKISLIQLNFIIGFLCLKVSNLFFQEMSFQLLAVHFQFVLGVSKLAQQIFHLVLLFAVFSHEFIIFTHESLIFASLVGIKLVKSHLHLLMNACQLVLKNFCFFFDFLSLEEDLIKFRLEFIVLIFNVLISHFNIFWSGVHSELVQG